MIKVFKSKNLEGSGINHGFFGRRGGVSKGIYESLNVGLGSDDVKSDVLENRKRVAEYMGVEPQNLITLFQCHSPKVIILDHQNKNHPSAEADALVTKEKGLAIGILTADCTPVLFSDHTAGVIGAAHAGWQGALSGILNNTIEIMEKLGATRENIKAAIGPAISQKSYEVGPDFRDQFMKTNESFQTFFVANTKGRFQFDLVGFNLLKLKEMQIESVENLNMDTYSNPYDFFSFRRTTHLEEPDYGRQISVIIGA